MCRLLNSCRGSIFPRVLSIDGSLCVDGYFEQFGVCVQCPATGGASGGAVFGIILALAAVCYCIFRVRMLLPVDVLKLGLSMLQV